MRMWMVDPAIMCRKHLLGEHVETHMFVGAIKKGTSLTGFVENGLFEPASLYARHDALAAEMERRGYKHKSTLEHVDTSAWGGGTVNRDASLADLLDRCPECHKRSFTRAPATAL